MDEDGELRTYTVRALNPKLEPSMVEESCPTAAAADARTKQLCVAGYNVTVIYSRIPEGRWA